MVMREDAPMSEYVGRQFTGFCGGLFGRESYGDKVIEGFGQDWIVARELDTGDAVFGWHPGADARELLAEIFGENN